LSASILSTLETMSNEESAMSVILADQDKLFFTSAFMEINKRG
jgi:hypothetical protein